MWLRAGIITIALLALSRLAGVVREASIAAVFGVTAQADLAVVLVGLPDLIAGAVGAGVVTYVMIPYWAEATVAESNRLTRRVAAALAGFGLLVGASMFLLPTIWLGVLAPNVSAADITAAVPAMQINGGALVLALGSVLACAKLLSSGDLVGLHASNLFVTGTLILALWFVPAGRFMPALVWLGLAVVGGHAMRAVWVAFRWSRLTTAAQAADAQQGSAQALPPRARWWFAFLAVSLPYAMPWIARSAPINGVEGSVAGFAFAWKLVELPLTLVLQWVGLLALPGLSRAIAANDRDRETRLLRQACLLSVMLALAASFLLVVGKGAWADLLFGWGKLSADQVKWIGSLAAWGSLTLVPQALFSVLMSRFAAAKQLGDVAGAAAFGLATLLSAIAVTPYLPSWFPASSMLQLLVGYWVAAIALMWRMDAALFRALPWGLMFGYGGTLLGCGAAVVSALSMQVHVWVHALGSVAAVTLVTMAFYALSAEFRQLLRR